MGEGGEADGVGVQVAEAKHDVRNTVRKDEKLSRISVSYLFCGGCSKSHGELLKPMNP